MKSLEKPPNDRRSALTLAEFASELTISYSMAKAMVREGKRLRVIRIGRRIIVPASEVDRILGQPEIEPFRNDATDRAG